MLKTNFGAVYTYKNNNNYYYNSDFDDYEASKHMNSYISTVAHCHKYNYI